MKNRQTIDRWAVWVQEGFWIYLCVAWSEPILRLQTAWEAGHAGVLILNSAMPIVRHRGLLLTASCLCIQHSSAGPPPGKQMAGNNTVTHPEHRHPGPGLQHALCYLSVCIASEIPPHYPHRATTRLGDIHEWNWLNSWAPLAQHTLLFYNESVSSELFKWSRRVWWEDVALSLGQRDRWPLSQIPCELFKSRNRKTSLRIWGLDLNI